MTNSERSSVVRSAAGRWTAAALAILATGCGSNDVTPPLTDESELFWSLELDHRAVTLSMTAPYDTLTVTAIPRNAGGQSLSNLGAPRYTSTDSSRVRVTPEGVLVAVTPTPNPVLVHATLTAGNLKHTDSLWVQVMAVDPPPVLAGLSVHPMPPDSAKVGAQAGLGFCGLLPLVLTDADGVSLVGSGIPVALHLPDTTVASVAGTPVLNVGNDGCIAGRRPGATRVYASATVFGVTKADTLDYRIGWPVGMSVQVMPAPHGAPGNVFAEREMRLGVGAVVVWQTLALETGAQVVIEDSVGILSPYERAWELFRLTPEQLASTCQQFGVDCNGGGTLTLSPGNFFGAFRVFSVPGTYRFKDPVSGDQARIIIIDES